MCAIAQQDREVRRIHPQRIDYITFEPFNHYMGKLQELRVSHDGSIWKHVAGMSQLSHKLLHMLGWSLVVLAIAAFFRVDNFSLPHLFCGNGNLVSSILYSSLCPLALESIRSFLGCRYKVLFMWVCAMHGYWRVFGTHHVSIIGHYPQYHCSHHCTCLR